MTNLHCFDFDGTLTTHDSLFAIIRYQRGMSGMLLLLLRHLPRIIMMKLGMRSNHATKEALLFDCFGHMTGSEFDSFAQRFAEAEHTRLLRPDIFAKFCEACQREEQVIVISASGEQWIRPIITKAMPAMTSPEPMILATQLNFDQPTARNFFLTPNCYGQEKVNRLLKAMPDIALHRADYHITAYGDSAGDREMSRYADDFVWVK